MISYQYTYLIGDLIILSIWVSLFLWRKDIRKEMLVISAIFGFVGLIAESIYILDWWKPLTITNTPVGMEDFLFGFGVGGIVSVVYTIIFKKRVKIKKINKKINKNLITLPLMGILLFLGSFFILRINTFYSSAITSIVLALIIWIKRKDLIVNSLATGIISALGAIPIFILLELISPGWVEAIWNFTNISKVIILTTPLDDILWCFFMGLFIGPLYEYWKEGKLINLKK